MLVHTVYFWLKEGSPASAAQQLAADCRQYLAKVPTVRQLFAGPPAKTTKREVIDDSYAIGLTVVFDDLAGHDVYQEHPLHLEFIARNKPNWSKVRVYDFA
jgi:hypothetical protein